MKKRRSRQRSTSTPSSSLADESESSISTTSVVDDNFIRSSVDAVEHILSYRFTDKSLLEAALTHSSYPDSPSYQRLEFVGDAALGLALANFVFVTYPEVDPGQLSLLRAANISTEKLARVAVRHRFFDYVRHCAPPLAAKVHEFTIAVEEEGDEILPYGGSIKAPKVLADIVESIASAVYVDRNFDLKFLWQIFNPILEPLVTVENLEQQPVTVLYELCQKEGKNVTFRHWKNGIKIITNVLVDGKVFGTASSEKKEISKLGAAKNALEKLLMPQCMPAEVHRESVAVDDINNAKQKLIEHCNKKEQRWPKPTFRVLKEDGPSHDRRFTCAVQIETLEGILEATGNVRQQKKDAENSAASMLLLHLLQGC